MRFDYELADLLAYDVSIWLALIRQYLQDWWPLPVLWPAVLVLLMWFARWWPTLLGLALAWCWVGSAFHLQQHQTLNWAAGYWATAWFIQGGLLALSALITRLQPTDRIGRRALVAGFALLLPPAAGFLLDGVLPWQGDVFGMTPDATAFATLLIVAGYRGRFAPGLILMLAIIPIAALAVSALFAQALGLLSPIALAAGGAAIGLTAMVQAVRHASASRPR